jgi:2-hydroxychromene-2-carboxylate isomerase
MLKTWRGGPNSGQPKVPPAAQGLLERGLLRLDTSRRMPTLFFTDEGIEALRAMMRDGRLADPEKFAHIRQELGIDPDPDLGVQTTRAR